MEPVYRDAWQLANTSEYRGRPWSEVEAAVTRNWQSSELSNAYPWSSAAGPIRDVWEDVAEAAPRRCHLSAASPTMQRPWRRPRWGGRVVNGNGL